MHRTERKKNKTEKVKKECKEKEKVVKKEAVSGRHLTAEVRIRALFGLCCIYDGHSGI
jgi:hypothetical protein